MDQFAFSPEGIAIQYILVIWSLFWKGIALWRASKLEQRYWFIVLLILNTLGIVEIIYLFKFATKKLTWEELKSYFNFNSEHITKIRHNLRRKK